MMIAPLRGLVQDLTVSTTHPQESLMALFVEDFPGVVHLKAADRDPFEVRLGEQRWFDHGRSGNTYFRYVELMDGSLALVRRHETNKALAQLQPYTAYWSPQPGYKQARANPEVDNIVWDCLWVSEVVAGEFLRAVLSGPGIDTAFEWVSTAPARMIRDDY